EPGRLLASGTRGITTTSSERLVETKTEPTGLNNRAYRLVQLPAHQAVCFATNTLGEHALQFRQGSGRRLVPGCVRVRQENIPNKPFNKSEAAIRSALLRQQAVHGRQVRRHGKHQGAFFAALDVMKNVGLVLG